MKLDPFVMFSALLVLSAPVYSARILGIVPTPAFSHQIAFRTLWKELSLQGHQVTLLTPFPIKDPSLKNLTEIDLSFAVAFMNSVQESEELTPNDAVDTSVIEMVKGVNEFGAAIIDAELQHPDVQKLLKDKNQHFDVVLVETIFPGMAAFAERFNCPLIQIFSLEAPILNYYLVGSPVHPVLNPDFMLPFCGKLSFFERLSSALYVPFVTLYSKFQTLPTQNAIIRKHFGDDTPTIEEILKKTSLVFVNTDNIFHQIRPLLPNIIQIGGGSHLAPSKPLPKNVQTVLDNAKKGAIYFSLGSLVKSNLLSDDIRKVFLETFAELPYTVLWKFEEELDEKPSNVFISKWFPQQDIFRHPNVKLFISQGGLQSMDEAVHNYIPIIGLPFLGDQSNNMRRIRELGIGLQLDIKTVNKNVLKDAIYEVMNNSKYRDKVKHLAELSKDQPMTGLERAVWWTEYVIRHKGAKHLRSPAIHLPEYQYYLLDVIGFCLAVILTVIYITVKIVIFISRIIRVVLPKSKVKIQ